MAHGQDRGYMDGVRVKISEKYKPPPRINLVTTYAQRLTTNKQIQENSPRYEFALEHTVKEKMKEWREARENIKKERETRQNRLKKFREDNAALKARAKEEEQGTPTTEQDENVTRRKVPENTSEAQVSSLLLPTQASCYSTILTPITLNPNETYATCKINDNSPFNIAEFEADTSSPFDNMALKSINDMEELAKVWKINTSDPVNTQYNSYSYSSAPQTQNSFYSNYNAYNQNGINYQSKPHTNGYYFSPAGPEVVTKETYPLYPQSYPSNHSIGSQFPSATSVENSKNFRSVPDIVKSIEHELKNTHLEHNGHFSGHDDSKRPKSTDSVCPVTKAKPKEVLEDPFFTLPLNLQEMSKSISSMGFPLPRVARVCKILGTDNKKVIEHLLAMTDLLDLGFTEKKVSDALLQCDNDRDKALDQLIS